MILDRINHLELTTESKSRRLSIIRFCVCQQQTRRFLSMHTYLTALLKEYLIVLAEGNTENDGRHILEAVNPLLTFTSLATDIEHTKLPVSMAKRPGGAGAYWMLSWPILNLVS